MGPVVVLLAFGWVGEDGPLQDARVGTKAVRVQFRKDFRGRLSDQPVLVTGGKSSRAVAVFAAMRAVRW
mgnify:CR=1 FL=1